MGISGRLSSSNQGGRPTRPPPSTSRYIHADTSADVLNLLRGRRILLTPRGTPLEHEGLAPRKVSQLSERQQMQLLAKLLRAPNISRLSAPQQMKLLTTLLRALGEWFLHVMSSYDIDIDLLAAALSGSSPSFLHSLQLINEPRIRTALSSSDIGFSYDDLALLMVLLANLHYVNSLSADDHVMDATHPLFPAFDKLVVRKPFMVEGGVRLVWLSRVALLLYYEAHDLLPWKLLDYSDSYLDDLLGLTRVEWTYNKARVTRPNLDYSPPEITCAPPTVDFGLMGRFLHHGMAAPVGISHFVVNVRSHDLSKAIWDIGVPPDSYFWDTNGLGRPIRIQLINLFEQQPATDVYMLPRFPSDNIFYDYFKVRSMFSNMGLETTPVDQAVRCCEWLRRWWPLHDTPADTVQHPDLNALTLQDQRSLLVAEELAGRSNEPSLTGELRLFDDAGNRTAPFNDLVFGWGGCRAGAARAIGVLSALGVPCRFMMWYANIGEPSTYSRGKPFGHAGIVVLDRVIDHADELYSGTLPVRALLLHQTYYATMMSALDAGDYVSLYREVCRVGVLRILQATDMLLGDELNASDVATYTEFVEARLNCPRTGMLVGGPSPFGYEAVMPAIREMEDVFGDELGPMVGLLCSAWQISEVDCGLSPFDSLIVSCASSCGIEILS